MSIALVAPGPWHRTGRHVASSIPVAVSQSLSVCVCVPYRLSDQRLLVLTHAEWRRIHSVGVLRAPRNNNNNNNKKPKLCVVLGSLEWSSKCKHRGCRKCCTGAGKKRGEERGRHLGDGAGQPTPGVKFTLITSPFTSRHIRQAEGVIIRSAPAASWLPPTPMTLLSTKKTKQEGECPEPRLMPSLSGVVFLKRLNGFSNLASLCSHGAEVVRKVSPLSRTLAWKLCVTTAVDVRAPRKHFTLLFTW